MPPLHLGLDVHHPRVVSREAVTGCWKEWTFDIRRTQEPVPALPLAACVTLDKETGFSAPLCLRPRTEGLCEDERKENREGVWPGTGAWKVLRKCQHFGSSPHHRHTDEKLTLTVIYVSD